MINPQSVFQFYRRHFELIEKYNVSLKNLLQQGICNPEFYGDLVYILNVKNPAPGKDFKIFEKNGNV